MPTMDALHFGPSPDHVTLWGGPADGQPWIVEGGRPDVEIPLRSETMPGVIPDENWTPTTLVAVYRHNPTTERYEYAGQVKK